MAEIEAFLRTGQAPPAAPEPAPAPSSPLPPMRPYQPGALDAGSGGSSGPGGWSHRSPRGRLSELPARLPLIRGWRRPDAGGPGGRGGAGAGSGGRVTGRLGGRLGGGRLGGPLRALRSRPLRPGGRSGHLRAPPRWTAGRLLGVVVVLLGLVLLPVLWSNRGNLPNPDGADHASTAPAGPGYAFLRVNRSGTPVRWNPCTSIYYQLDMAAAPSWAMTDIGNAITAISAATGIQFVPDGPTNQFPSGSVPLGSGTAESPVVIAWATPAQSRALGMATELESAAGAFPGEADSLGHTVPVVASDELTGHMVYVSGSIVLSSAASQLPAGFGAGGDGILLLHQLGRLVGLGDLGGLAGTGQVMNPSVLSSGLTGLGAGDRAGLTRLGKESGCLTVPSSASLEPVI
jgi:hypothetical protein